jgi:hypothetical protein
MVTFSFKRRTASRQAVSRKVEGIEPRKKGLLGRMTLFSWAEVNTSTPVNGKGMFASSGSMTMACLTL